MTKTISAREHFERELATLVARFGKHHDDYLRADYSETDVRAEFIDPFFEALGWDLKNRAGRSPKTREVFREAGETHGRVDYVFRIDSRDVFYVEAKAPHVPLERTDVAMQAKRYAWNSPNVFIAAVTDFEEFRLYDATGKPDRKHPHAGLIFDYRYTDYLKPKALDDLWLLSREAVGAGSIDQLLKQSPMRARNRVPIDQAFLEDLSGWREQLAKAVFKTKPDLSPADLNSIVQVFLDRLIFIRICEDRRVIDPHQLSDVVAHWEYSGKRVSIATDLNALFHDINDRLNGEIFKPHACEKIDWDMIAELVADVIKNLYFPTSPYLFDKIPVELLGSIYERYLGKTIRVTETRAVVEDKPEVRKAGGVYYTPKYIVDYIVAQTVGKLIEGKTPKQIEKLRFLDPACGSGSFLIGAYQKLLDFHTAYYAERAQRRGGGSPHQARLLQEPAADYGEFKLALEQKAQILRNNIFGVDIDPQAVEITMMSLYIKMLEDERGFLAGRAILPRLRDNIKWGNSLIGYDIGKLSDDDKARINPFDWHSQGEGFGAIMDAGGFDAVIGNPPYGAYLYETEKGYLNSKYNYQSYQLDSYLLFLEKSTRDLLKRSGFLGMIMPNPWLTNLMQGNIRKFVTENLRIVEIAHFRFPVFSKVTVDTEIVVLQNSDPKGWQSVATIVESLKAFEAEAGKDDLKRIHHSQDEWRESEGEVINIFVSPAEKSLTRKCVRLGMQLDTLCDINVGIKPYQVGKGNPPQTREIVEKRIYDSDRQSSKLYRPYLRGSDIGRYKIEPIKSRFIKYGAWLAEPRPAANFDAPEKIVVRQTGDSIVAALDAAQYLCLNNMHVLVPIKTDVSLRYILGVVNSRLLNWYYHTLNPEVGEALAEVKKTNVARLPIRISNDPSHHTNLVALVERMLDLYKQKQSSKSDTARERIEREINVTDEQIDALVYELYGLTKEEIKIVEADKEPK